VYVYEALPRVGVNTKCPSCYRDCGKNEKVAGDGTFTVHDLDGTMKFRLLAVADGYESQFGDFVASGPLRLTLEPRAGGDLARLVCGRVLDPDGNPVIGAIVESQGVHVGSQVVYGKFPGLEFLSITNEQGEFAMSLPEREQNRAIGLDDDSWALDVRVRARNFALEIARDFQPAVDYQTVHVDLGAAIAGRLVHDGRPQAGVSLIVDHRDHWSRNYLGNLTIATDERGAFVVTGLGPNEDYILLLDKPLQHPTDHRGRLVHVGGDATSVDLGDVELSALGAKK
jgi:hypothetical protein